MADDSDVIRRDEVVECAACYALLHKDTAHKHAEFHHKLDEIEARLRGHSHATLSRIN